MVVSVDKIWAVAQEHLRSALSANTYNNWFAPLRASAGDANTIVLEANNDFCATWLRDNYLELLREVIGLTSGRQLQVKLKGAATGSEGERSATTPPTGPKPATVEALPAPAPGLREPSLNPRNTFGALVVGESNNFAYAAAVAVARAPGKAYNPLLLCGGPGLGKTHLLHAIGHYIVENREGGRVHCLSSEEFTNEFLDCVQGNQLAAFRNKYRQADALLLDDVQFLAGKERVQEEFLHTFNALHQKQRQIVLTCDQPAGEVEKLERRLVSRFACGLVTDLEPPGMEMRLEILHKKARALGAEVPESILSFIAGRIRGNIRQLEGALTRVASYAMLTKKELSQERVAGLLGDLLAEAERPAMGIDIIKEKVAAQFNIPVEEMSSRRRPEKVAFPRQVAMFIARELTETSLSEIGAAFGGRDHATVLRACRLVKDRMEVDPRVRRVVKALETQLAR